jgi:hypothetical protein
MKTPIVNCLGAGGSGEGFGKESCCGSKGSKSGQAARTTTGDGKSRKSVPSHGIEAPNPQPATANYSTTP